MNPWYVTLCTGENHHNSTFDFILATSKILSTVSTPSIVLWHFVIVCKAFNNQLTIQLNCSETLKHDHILLLITIRGLFPVSSFTGSPTWSEFGKRPFRGSINTKDEHESAADCWLFFLPHVGGQLWMWQWGTGVEVGNCVHKYSMEEQGSQHTDRQQQTATALPFPLPTVHTPSIHLPDVHPAQGSGLDSANKQNGGDNC